jgi:hypothetical protein
MRKEAEKRHPNLDESFKNVGLVAADRIDVGTTTCVRNIDRRHLACRLTPDARLAADKARGIVQK